jgi:hypothetical protein
MLLQVFADGTVIDSEGVHRLSASELRPLVEATQNSELSRVRGHCGTPPNDFIEYVHIVIFERRMGRLQAHSFSYAGNPQGCDNGIRYLHTALENLQAKLSRQPAAAEAAGAPAATPTFAPIPPAASARSATRSSSSPTLIISPVNGPATDPPLPDPSSSPGSGSSSGSVITLTPITPR